MSVNIKEGDYTSTIYGLIGDKKYADAIRCLQLQEQTDPINRAALSLLGYCYFESGEPAAAAECYERLAQHYPQFPHYRLYQAQSLLAANLTQQALAVVQKVDEPSLLGESVQLEAAVRYREEDVENARILVQQLPGDIASPTHNACLDYKEQRYDEALEKFQDAINTRGYRPDLGYSVALCHYRRGDYQSALKNIADIVDRAVQKHPELGVGLASEGVAVSHSVGNTPLLHESAIVEALNLKFAIEYRHKNMAAAREALTDLPPRTEEELDAVTLHNQALLDVHGGNTSHGFAKLQYLLAQNPFPQETFANLLLLYCKYEYYELAADVLAENAHLTYKYLSQWLYDYLDAVILSQTAAREAHTKLDSMCGELLPQLRRLAQQIQETDDRPKEHTLRSLMRDYDDCLEKYLAVLMSSARIDWDASQWARVEAAFQQSVEFCSENDVWRLNAAHTLFMQEKWREAAAFYQPVVHKHFDNMLQMSAVALANLCVCYILTNQNEEAEELMRKVEREEDAAAAARPSQKTFHLCIINLVIGTLYCSKGNFEFGLGRIMQAMEPLERKLGSDTWYYAKRALLAAADALSRQLTSVRDSAFSHVLSFLDQAADHGSSLPAQLDGAAAASVGIENGPAKVTVSREARLLKALYLGLRTPSQSSFLEF